MKVLFLSLAGIRDIDAHGIYSDLLRVFARNGHEVYIITPAERRMGVETHLETPKGNDWHQNVHILFLKTGNIQKTNVIEKGISTLLIEYQITSAIRRYFAKEKFDLVLYATPPITLVDPIRYVKKRDGARTYLMLKDIFPQNAVDLEMMSTTGIKGLLYKYFRAKEKDLYAVSDKIGCMSQANVDYVLKHNPEIPKEKVEICPNAIEVIDKRITPEKKMEMRQKYGLPLDKKIFVYGGNLGKPQGIPFLIECLRAEKENDKAFFLIVGDGTEYGLLENFVNTEKPQNMRLMQRLHKEDYDALVAACDVGMIFLDHRFTIPNFPSRLLSYMQAGLPVLACTDPNTDIGTVITKGGFGWWCESDDVKAFTEIVNSAVNTDTTEQKRNAEKYMADHYSVEIAYDRIIESVMN